MAKRTRVLPARKQRDRSRDDESLLMRSAESLGRVIGSLQRQLDGAARRVSVTADDVMGNLPDITSPGAGRGSRKGRATTKPGAKKRAATRTAATRKTTGAKSTGTRRASARKTSKKR
jgi:hypothetical protein